MTKSADAFRTISEVAEWLGVQPHVLRFWESKFSQVKPVKRAGGRRYYRPNDMLLLGGLRKLLHEDGLTIKGAQKVLREQGMAHVASLSMPLEGEDPSDFYNIDEKPSDTVIAEPEPIEDLADEDGDDDRVVAFERRSDPVEEKTAPKAETVDAPDDEPVVDEPTDETPISVAEDTSGSEDTLAVEDGIVEDGIVQETADALPAFLTGRTSDPQPSSADVTPSDNTPPEAEAAPEPATDVTADGAEQNSEPPAGPKPNIIDAPDPDEASYDIQPSALSAVARARELSAAQRAEITPLVARLAALRDRQAAARSGNG